MNFSIHDYNFTIHNFWSTRFSNCTGLLLHFTWCASDKELGECATVNRLVFFLPLVAQLHRIMLVSSSCCSFLGVQCQRSVDWPGHLVHPGKGTKPKLMLIISFLDWNILLHPSILSTRVEDVSILISTSPKWILTMRPVPKFLHWVFQSLEVQPTSRAWHVSAAWQASFTIDWNSFTSFYFVPWGRQTCYQFWDSCPRSRVLLSRMILCPGCI